MLLRKRFAWHTTLMGIISLVLSGCYQPPYNNFKPYKHTAKDAATGAAVGSVVGAIAGSALIGTGIGMAAFTANGLYKDSKKNVLRELFQSDIQYVEYGDTHTLIVPTDRYFLFNSPHLNDLCYPGLVLIVKLLRFYPESVIYVAGFTDNIGSRYHKRMLSQARAETMLTFLWANNINARRLNAEGYGDKNTVSDNKIIHGSAQNRRLEIQWFNSPIPQNRPAPIFMGNTK